MSAILKFLVYTSFVILLLSFTLAIATLIRPRLLKFLFRKIPSRKRISFSFIGIVISLFLFIGILASIDTKDFPQNSTSGSNSAATVSIKKNVNANAIIPTKKFVQAVIPPANWKTYVDSVSDYSIQYPPSYYINNIQRSGGNEPSMVDFNISSNNLSTEDDENAFSVLATKNSSFADPDHSPQSCKDDSDCTYTRIVNNNKIPLECYNIGNSPSNSWISQSNSYICRFTNINTDLVIWVNTNRVDKKTRDSIINSFYFVSSPESSFAIKQEVNQYGATTQTLNNQVVTQSLVIAKDLVTIQNAKYAQLTSVLPQIKSDLNTAQTTFQQVFSELNTVHVPYDMEAAHAHYQKGVNDWVQTTKAILKGVNDNNEAEILSAQDIVKKADGEVKAATDQLNNYKAYSGN